MKKKKNLCCFSGLRKWMVLTERQTYFKYSVMPTWMWYIASLFIIPYSYIFSIADVDALPDDLVCKICMDSMIDCVLLECGHMVACTMCGKQMSECPVCRQYVVRVVRTFRAWSILAFTTC